MVQAEQNISAGIPFVGILIILLGVAVLAMTVILIVTAITASKNSKNKIGTANRDESYFDGSTLQRIGYLILTSFVSAITLGIAYPWMLCVMQSWELKHTVINGRRLKFNGAGHQLIGKFILWVFLSLITCGIYGIWLGLSVKKWVVKHTVYEDDEKPVESYFSGGVLGYAGTRLLAFLITVFTLGIGKAWADTMIERWNAEHTHIGGSPMVFVGTGGQLFVKYLLLVILTPLTIGIYPLFFTVSYKKWQVSSTQAMYRTPAIQAKARSHESAALQDFAKFRLAANDSEIAMMKSGYTGKEDENTLSSMAEGNNPFAAFRLAEILKGDGVIYEGKAAELLGKAADARYHVAMLTLAKQLPVGTMIPMLTEAAQLGSAEASKLLVSEYLMAGDLFKAAYWFKIAIEWGIEDEEINPAEYERLIKNLSLKLSEDTVKTSGGGGAAVGIVVGIVAVAAVLALVVGAFLLGITPAGLFGGNNKEAAVQMIDPQDTELIRPFAMEKVEGNAFHGYDHNGASVDVTVNESIFVDVESNVFYVEVGVEKCDQTFVLGNGMAWCSDKLTESGLYKIEMPVDGFAGEYIHVQIKDDYGSMHSLGAVKVSIKKGSSEEAAEWIEANYSVRAKMTTEEALIGAWESQALTYDGPTGEERFEMIKFEMTDDGRLYYSRSLYEPDATNGLYGGYEYEGRFWTLIDGNGLEGTYEVNEGEITLYYLLEGTTEDRLNFPFFLHENNDMMTVHLYDGPREFEYLG